MIRPSWTFRTDEERQAIARLEIAAEEHKVAEDRLWQAAQQARKLGIEANFVAEKALTSRATLYRELGKRFPASGVAAPEQLG
ncbi:hypothetical protein [Dactylosporangium salmoneum]|uniref:Transposase n=1 Tax=Dactylosporangium salmoneum TaxID=53361 RepID=A0ABN3GA96_9ACTN